MKRETIKEKRVEWLFLAGLCVFYFMWAYIQPLNASPDEEMRYLIPKFIFKHGTLPVGADPEIMNMVWGNSYGFNPIFSYIVSAIFMKAISFFSSEVFALLMAARTASVMFGVGTAAVTIKISKKLFEKNSCRWLFVVLITMWPQMIYISSYVNTDAFALFTTACVIYSWILGLESNWSYKHCAYLGVALGLCALSYYNAYGFLVMSLVIFVFSVLLSTTLEVPWHKKVGILIKKGMFILLITLACAGWWFVRSFILYDGDIFGMAACNACAELYAAPEYKPSLRVTPFSQGMSLKTMLLSEGWLKRTLYSFIGYFGYFDYPLKWWMYKFYNRLILLGGIGTLIHVRSVFFQWKTEKWSKEKLFNWVMAVSMIFPVLLSLYYSYYSDFQPQGRYILPIMIPFAYFLTVGFQKLVSHIPKKYEKAGRVIIDILIAAVFCMGILSYVIVFLPNFV